MGMRNLPSSEHSGMKSGVRGLGLWHCGKGYFDLVYLTYVFLAPQVVSKGDFDIPLDHT